MDIKSTKDYKEFDELGYKLLNPINKEETKKNMLHLYKDGNYVASIKRVSKGKFSFKRKSYVDKKELLEKISEYNKNLEFSAKTYDPDMRDDYRTDIRIYETIKNFGFKQPQWSSKLVADGILGMQYGTVYDQERLAINANSWINLYNEDCKTDESKCASIRSMLFALYASNISKLCELLKNTGKLSQLKDIKVNRLNEKTMEVEEVSMLDNIKGILEKGISVLK
jgi:hypothetical protein